jgi:exonuclease III
MSTTSRTSSADESSKRQKTCQDDEESQTHRHPRSFVTWNCNGLTSRCCFNLVDLNRLLDETNKPDMICMQEVRLAAIGPIGRQRGIPKKDDAKKKNSKQHKSVKETLNVVQSVFGEYQPFWSLSDKMYSGTVTLIHQRCLLEASISDFAAFTPQSAIDLMLRRLGKTRQDCGLSKPSPTKKPQQTCLASFFAPNKQADSDHDAEGRFQFFFFPDMDVVHTYVPNNGTEEKSFQRRRNWDEDLLQFWKDRKQVLDSCGIEKASSSGSTADVSKDRKLLWCGDLNVARDYRDGTHWERRPARGPSTTAPEIYEWWTDESRCLAQDSLQKNPTRNKKPENVGMPSFTPAERSRFNEMIREANLCDVWRELHPNGATTLRKIDRKDDSGSTTTTTTTTTTTSNPWDLPNYTWRGAAAIKSGGRPAKYEGRGQRLDYFLISPYNRFSVENCEILGQGERKEGLFCGSDHCAVSLRI